MEEEVKGIRDYLEIVWRRKYWILIPAIILMIATAIVTYSLPATYKSEGLILIESQEIPQDLIRTTVTSYADQRIEVIKQRLMTTTRVMQIVNKYNLYPEERQKTPSTAPIVSLFKENVSVDIVQANVTDPVSGRAKRASIAFRVSFLDKSPQLAQQVANELVTEFLNENVRTRTDRAEDTTQFLKLEGDRLQKEVQQTEREIAEFRDEYSDSLPDLLQYNLSMVQSTQQEIAATENQIMMLSDQVTTMGLQLSMIPREASAGMSATSPNQPSNAQVALEQLRAEYRSMQSKYSENHPDLQRVKREMDALAAQLGESMSPRQSVEMQLEDARSNLQSLKQRYSSEHPDVKAEEANVSRLDNRLAELPAETSASTPAASSGSTNPVYIEVKAKIDATQREISRLRERQVSLREKLADFEQRVVKTNQVQRAYLDLTRDHENKLNQYRQLRAKQLQAELAETLESENKGESFTLIEPPQVPNSAEKPNRPKLLAMGFVASMGAGVGLAVLIEMFFGGVRGYTNISRIVGKPPLVVIPLILTEAEKSKRRKLLYRLVFILFLLGIAAVVLFHFLIMDLEVFWFKLLNKLSLL
ncbi:GumC family protein [Methylophaga pinxianii]|uniref:GumC family protein n=1 Tax=Methylophaga pinxianii TaxID=2881052 RepID=UPI001CF24215|nr:Wzz/FepE/Etk N-terminal domain-containing protein [Methylophaga pinxianii]MCB2425879.1 sugar transporter [Methylophaga pinxianii]UPH45119.1 Wzz/FepE/Etk N-terminal domain-containing protein [Methylophaga pinxianii]